MKILPLPSRHWLSEIKSKYKLWNGGKREKKINYVGRCCIGDALRSSALVVQLPAYLDSQWWEIWLKKWILRVIVEDEDAFFFAPGGRLSSLRSSSPADVTFNQTVTQFPGARWESCLSLTDATLWRELMSGSRISLIPTSQQTSRNRITATVPVRSVIFLCRNHPLMATPALT